MGDRTTPFLRLLGDIKQVLDRLVEAITEYQQANQAKEKEKLDTEVKAVVRLPVEITKYYESEERERPKTSNRDKIRMYLEIAGVAAAVGLAVITLCTLRVFNEQLVEMRKQTTTLSHQATQSAMDSQQQISLSGDQVKAAQDSVDAINKQTLLDQRPWIGVVGNNTIGGTIETLKDALRVLKVQNVTITIQNSGKTPAIQITTACCIQRMLIWTAPIPDYDTEVVAERAKYNATVQRMKAPLQHIQDAMRNKRNITSEQMKRMKEEEKFTIAQMNITYDDQFPKGFALAPNASSTITLFNVGRQWNIEDKDGNPLVVYILGKFIYQDIFGKIQHSTKFCLMTRDVNFTVCPKNNWMD